MIDKSTIEHWKSSFGPDGDGLSQPYLSWTHATRRLLAEREELLSLLREVEWVQLMRPDGGYTAKRCPRCDRDRQDGHDPGCHLAAALR